MKPYGEHAPEVAKRIVEVFSLPYQNATLSYYCWQSLACPLSMEA